MLSFNVFSTKIYHCKSLNLINTLKTPKKGHLWAPSLDIIPGFLQVNYEFIYPKQLILSSWNNTISWKSYGKKLYLGCTYYCVRLSI